MRFWTSVVLTGMMLGFTAGCCRQEAAPPSVPAAAAESVAVVETIPELPVYPGAVRVKYTAETPPVVGMERSFEAEYLSPDALAGVVQFYRTALVESGWQVVASEEKPDEVEWSLAREGAAAEVEVEAEAAGGVKIKLERKDR